MNEPTSIDKVILFMPIESWSEIIMTLDKMLELVCTRYGFGEVTMTFIIHRGNIIEVTYADKISVRGTKATTPTSLQDKEKKVPMPPISMHKPTSQNTIDNK